MTKKEALTEAWVKDGMLRILDDGQPAWSAGAINLMSASHMTLLSTLRTEGRHAFEEACKISGYKPEKILEEHWLSSDEVDYGMPLEG